MLDDVREGLLRQVDGEHAGGEVWEEGGGEGGRHG